MIVTTPHVDPWSNPAFAPLPEAVVKALKAVNAIEMPTRHAFEETFNKFLTTLSAELRETATFPSEVYAELAGAISDGRVNELSSRLRMWASCHHARAGSRKHHLILLPRDAFYNMNPADEERLRANYIVRTDGEGPVTSEKERTRKTAQPRWNQLLYLSECLCTIKFMTCWSIRTGITAPRPRCSLRQDASE